MVLDRAAGPEWAQVSDRVVDRLLERQVREILTEPGRRDRAADLRLAARWSAIAEQRGEQCGLAGAVGSDERDHVAALCDSREVVDENALADLHGEMVGRDHAIATPLGRLEPQRHRSGRTRRRREARQAFEPLATPLRLRRVHTGEVAPDVVLFFRDELPLALDLTIAREPALGALVDETRVAAAIRFRRSALDMEDVVGDLVEERTVV